MALLRVLLGFADAPDHQLEETAGQVIAHFYGNPIFPAPPVTVAALTAALTAFTDAIAAQAQGGTQATAAKDAARQELTRLLRLIAQYVQSTIQANPAYGLAELLSSGFDAVSTNRTQQPLSAPTGVVVENAGAGALKLRFAAIANSRLYEAQKKSGTGDWEPAGMFQSTRGMIISGLAAGTTYTLRVRAVGGSTGFSEWSDPVTRMSL